MFLLPLFRAAVLAVGFAMLSACMPFVDKVLQPEHAGSHAVTIGSNCQRGGAKPIAVPVDGGVELTAYPLMERDNGTLSVAMKLPSDGRARFVGHVATLEFAASVIRLPLVYLKPTVRSFRRELIPDDFKMDGRVYEGYSFEVTLTAPRHDEFVLSMPELIVGDHSVGVVRIGYRRRSVARVVMMCS